MAEQTGKSTEPTGSGHPPEEALLWPFSAAKLAMEACLWWLDRSSADPRETALAWTRWLSDWEREFVTISLVAPG